MDYQLHISAIRTTWSSCDYEFMVYITKTCICRDHDNYVESKLKEFFGEVRFSTNMHSNDGTYKYVYLCGKKHQYSID